MPRVALGECMLDRRIRRSRPDVVARDTHAIDAELALIAALRRSARLRGGPLPANERLDGLLDERLVAVLHTVPVKASADAVRDDLNMVDDARLTQTLEAFTDSFDPTNCENADRRFKTCHRWHTNLTFGRSRRTR